MKDIRRICLLGLGEVGSTLATDLSSIPGLQLVTWDWQFNNAFSTPSRNLLERSYLQAADNAGSAANGCELVISAVTAAQALPAAISVLPALQPGSWFLDLNSVSPNSKKNIGNVVEAAGAQFVEAAIMSPIAPLRSASPILLGGVHAEAFMPGAHELGFTGMRNCSSVIGKAAATKMCRSIVVKGMESLLTEALLTARFHGVENDVIASLGQMFPHSDWPSHARYMISRSLQHGIRRAEEIREAAQTVAEAGIEPIMSDACAARQEWSAQFAAALEQEELGPMLDEILRLNETGNEKFQSRNVIA